MAARRAAPPAPPPLTDGDVDLLRQRLAAGEAPRVVIRAASAAVPAGTRGTVVRLGDPASEDEYVVVRIKSDEVPFSPNELSLPGAKPKPAGATGEPAAAKAPATRSAARPAKSAPRRAAAPAPSAVPAPAPPPASTAAKSSNRRPASGRRPSRRGASRKPAAPLTVTLRFDGGGWSAEAARGARRLARPAPLRPGAVSALAEHVDDESLRTALVETVEACRAVVEEQAARLREELLAAEAALRDYETRPRRH